MTKGPKPSSWPLGAVVAAVLVGVLVVAVTSDPAQVRLGDDEFNAGYSEVLADAIAEGDGQPLVFSDVSGGDRDVYVQHLGDDGAIGWYAFEARIPGTDDCLAEWGPRRAAVRVELRRLVTFPADGTGLGAYPTRVNEDGRVIVDLRTGADATTTTEAEPGAPGRPMPVSPRRCRRTSAMTSRFCTWWCRCGAGRRPAAPAAAPCRPRGGQPPTRRARPA